MPTDQKSPDAKPLDRPLVVQSNCGAAVSAALHAGGTPTPQLIRPASDRPRVLATITQLVANTSDVPVDQIHESDHLVADLGCDSLDLVEISMAIEEEFQISVPDNHAERFQTVADIVNGVLELLRKRPEPSTVPSPG